MWVPLTIVFFSINPKHTAYFCCLQSGSSHINLCLCPDIQPLLFFPAPFPLGSSLHQGHVLLYILA